MGRSEQPPAKLSTFDVFDQSEAEFLRSMSPDDMRKSNA